MLKLVPFSLTQISDLFSVETKIESLHSEKLVIHYHIHGPLEKILIPKLLSEKSRQDELWRHTCLEAFFSSELTASSPYFEINCSPSGNWNAYGFSSYRQGMCLANLTVELTQVEINSESAVFEICISGTCLRHAKHCGITSILEFNDGSKAYFALKHPGNQADFHLKDSFIISL